MKTLSRIQRETGANGVHHHGKDKARGAAGSYAITAAADVILSVFKTGEEGAVKKRYVTLTKSRYRGTGRKIDFELVSLPPDHRDEEGDEEVFVRPLLDDRGTAEQPPSKPLTSRGENAFCNAAKNASNMGLR